MGNTEGRKLRLSAISTPEGLDGPASPSGRKLHHHSGSTVRKTRGALWLSPIQQQLIRKSWARAPKRGKKNFGACVFLRIFHKRPDVFDLFSFRGVPYRKLSNDGRFQVHCHSFIQVFDMVVENVDSFGSVTQYLQGLGRRHATLFYDKLRADSWDTFVETLLSEIKTWPGIEDEGLRAWRALIQYIVAEMKKGLTQEIRIQHAKSSYPLAPKPDREDNNPLASNGVFVTSASLISVHEARSTQ